MSTSNTSQKLAAAPTPETEDQDQDMMDRAPDSPVEPTLAQLAASGVLASPPQQQQQNGSGPSRANGDGGGKGSHGAPGSSWQNKKFTEEYEYAAARLCHQEYDPARYGDPLMQ